jgi:hypothetical protein
VKDMALKIIAGVLFVFSIFGMIFVFQRETAILQNQAQIGEALSRQDVAIKEIVAYLNKQSQPAPKIG